MLSDRQMDMMMGEDWTPLMRVCFHGAAVTHEHIMGIPGMPAAFELTLLGHMLPDDEMPDDSEEVPDHRLATVAFLMPREGLSMVRKAIREGIEGEKVCRSRMGGSAYNFLRYVFGMPESFPFSDEDKDDE